MYSGGEEVVAYRHTHFLVPRGVKQGSQYLEFVISQYHQERLHLGGGRWSVVPKIFVDLDRGSKLELTDNAILSDVFRLSSPNITSRALSGERETLSLIRRNQLRADGVLVLDEYYPASFDLPQGIDSDIVFYVSGLFDEPFQQKSINPSKLCLGITLIQRKRYELR